MSPYCLNYVLARSFLHLSLSKQHIKNRLNEPSQPPATVLAEICTLYALKRTGLGYLCG